MITSCPKHLSDGLSQREQHWLVVRLNADRRPMAEIVHCGSNAVCCAVNIGTLVGHDPSEQGTRAAILHNQDRRCFCLVVTAGEGVVERHLWDRIGVLLNGTVGRVVAAARHTLLAPAAVREVSGLVGFVFGTSGNTGVSGRLGQPSFFRRVLLVDLVAVPAAATPTNH